MVVLTNNTSNCLELEFACLKLGAVYVPLNWRLTVPELEYILKDCTPRVFVHEDVFAEAAQTLQKSCAIEHLLELNASGRNSDYEAAIAEHDRLTENAELKHDDLWVIMYTSGTTGHPKGAMITYQMTLYNVTVCS